MLERLVESLETCPIVKRGDYDYFIHPVTDGMPRMEPALLGNVCTAMVKVPYLQNVSLLVVERPWGFPSGRPSPS
jgi:adenine phosphoribosyltransferase